MNMSPQMNADVFCPYTFKCDISVTQVNHEMKCPQKTQRTQIKQKYKYRAWCISRPLRYSRTCRLFNIRVYLRSSVDNRFGSWQVSEC